MTPRVHVFNCFFSCKTIAAASSTNTSIGFWVPIPQPEPRTCLIANVLSGAERLAEAAGRLIDDEKHALALCQLLLLYPNEGVECIEAGLFAYAAFTSKRRRASVTTFPRPLVGFAVFSLCDFAKCPQNVLLCNFGPRQLP